MHISDEMLLSLQFSHPLVSSGVFISAEYWLRSLASVYWLRGARCAVLAAMFWLGSIGCDVLAPMYWLRRTGSDALGHGS